MPFLRWLLVLTVILLPGVFASNAASARPVGQPSATAGGRVVSIGFEGHFHLDSWVPMRVSVSPPGGETGIYQIRVHQRDLDGDNVVFQRSVTLTGGLPNQEFWTYFRPEPVDGGLSASDLLERLRVVLADEEGRELAQLSMSGVPAVPLMVNSVMPGASGRGKRMILLVSDAGGFFPGAAEYGVDQDGLPRTVGITEELAPVLISPAALPDRWIGYGSVDTIVWQDADPAVLLQGGGERMTALRQWIRNGGKLVVTARSEWQSLEPLFDLLPVTPTGAVELPDLSPLWGIVSNHRNRSNLNPQQWLSIPGPFRYIAGAPKPDAIVEDWFSYEQAAELGGTESGTVPLMARRPEGFGSVTWLALDLSNSSVVRSSAQQGAGWSIVWGQLLGLGDEPVVNPGEEEVSRHAAREARDLGYALLPGSRLAGRSVALVTVALVFFIIYWLVAGPGLYFYLVAKRRTPMSWFFFGATAVIATLVTLGVVRLVLRGAPDLRHVSIARQGTVAPQAVHTEMGLYIPEDGTQRLLVDGGIAGVPPILTGFAIHPDHHSASGRRSNPINYVVSLDPPADARGEGSMTQVDIPYRSTLKKLEAQWIGPMELGIEGTPRLVAGSTFCTGRLTNVTGRNLVNVYVAFRYPRGNGHVIMVVFIPNWGAGQTIEGLDTLIAPPEGTRMRIVGQGTGSAPTRRQSVYGELALNWATYWYDGLRSGMLSTTSTQVDDWSEDVRRTPAMLSLFSLLPPMRQRDIGGGGDATILLRRGARELDVSAAVLAGNMVVIGEAEEVPLPVPLRVDGDPVEGAGRTIYQIVVPLDRSAVAEMERQPPAPDGEAPPDAPTTNPTGEADAAAPPDLARPDRPQ